MAKSKKEKEISEKPALEPTSTDLIESQQETEEVKEPEIIEPEKSEEVNPEPVVAVAQEELTAEQRIENYLEGKTGEVRLNEFLKSLCGIPKPNEKPAWLDQNVNKSLRATLDGMVKRGQLSIVNDQHLRLGQFYYIGHDPVTQHHNLGSLNIVAIR